MKHVHRTALAAAVLAATALIALAGCKKRDQLPDSWAGRYRRPAFFGLAADQYVVVGPRTLTVENCQVNCGAPVLQLTSVTCTGGGFSEECRFTSEHCTGTVSTDSAHRLSVTATATPTAATGEALRLHNETCNNVRANLMERAQ